MLVRMDLVPVQWAQARAQVRALARKLALELVLGQVPDLKGWAREQGRVAPFSSAYNPCHFSWVNQV
jgi:hypothetical protein